MEIIGLICEPLWTMEASWWWWCGRVIHTYIVGQWRRCKGREEGEKHLFIYLYLKKIIFK